MCSGWFALWITCAADLRGCLCSVLVVLVLLKVRLAADELLCELLLPLRLLFSSFFFFFFAVWLVCWASAILQRLGLGKTSCVGQSCIGSWWTLTSPLERLWLHFTVHCVIFVPVTSPRQQRLVSQFRTLFNSHQCLGERSSSVLINEDCSWSCVNAYKLKELTGLCVIELGW